MLCAVKEDTYLKKASGILIKKMKFFFGDFLVFLPRTERQVECDITTAQQTSSLPRQISHFTQQEMQAFNRIAEKLKPCKDDSDNIKGVLRVINEHMCSKQTRLTSPEKQ